ncbi:hypothetical protein GCM10023347_34100 [Streptomyces chumphonensis]|uniref:Uncharacterized protein n=1 Tax=Streptomyces chumphonensis TaxID=1214925 RepID=A0A927ICI4_9ACTN|nr:hypothetical protein [Streptomyces chumphonensis]MBD3931920.1 hypothetical protein [Streptomyces chumphonensis]
MPNTLVEILTADGWVNITQDAYNRDPIVISRGRPDEATASDPGSCELTLNNRHGKYSPRNPLSPYYGLIGRNTPIRVWAQGPTPYLWIGATNARATVASSTALDVAEDLDVAVELALDQVPVQSSSYAPWSMEIMGRYQITGDQRMWRVMVDQLARINFVWSADGIAFSVVASSEVLRYRPGQRFALRATLDVDDDAGGHTVRFFTAPTMAGPWEQLGDAHVGAGTTGVFQAGTADLEVGSISGLGFSAGRGRYYAVQLRDGIDGPLLADVDFTAHGTGSSDVTDTVGRTWQFLNLATRTRYHRRFYGEVSSWPSRWDVSGADVYVPVMAHGPLRRLGQGQLPLHSTLRRRIATYPGLVGYWPLEEGTSAAFASTPIEGVIPLSAEGMDWAADTTLPGSGPLPKLTADAVLYGAVPAAPDGSWHLECVYYLPELPASAETVLEVRTTSSPWPWLRIEVTATAVRVVGIQPGEETSSTTLLINVTNPNVAGQWNRLWLRQEQEGGSIRLRVGWVTIGGIGLAADTSYTGTVGHVTRIHTEFGAGLEGMSLGHVALFEDDTNAFNLADTGFDGEPAGERLRRLAEEEALKLTTPGLRVHSEALGPQPIDTYLRVVTDAAEADGGVLYELRDAQALHYLPKDVLYDRAPALVLDYTQGHIAPPLEPVDDDQATRNDITIGRRGGASARVRAEEGPLSVLPHPDGVGVYEDSATLNVEGDGQLEPIAAWRLHLGTWDEARYPVVRIQLTADSRADLRQQVLDGLDVQAVMRLANLPAWMPPGDVDLVVAGYTETLTLTTWDIEANSHPAGPWSVASLVGEEQLREGFEDATYDDVLDLTDGGDAPWTRDNTQAHAGAWSLRSGTITNNQTSDLVLTLPPDAQELSFWYMTSSETSGPGYDGDFLAVLEDGSEVLRAQGETSWTRHTLDVRGSSTVTFRYSKDNSAGAGSDAAWIDDLTVTVLTDAGTDQPNRVDTDGSQVAAAVDETATTLDVHTPQPDTGQVPAWIVSAGPGDTFPGDFPFDLRVGGEVVRATACEPLGHDAFGRTETDTWGTADSGQAWSNVGTATDFAVAGGTGTITLTSPPETIRRQALPVDVADCEVLVRLSVDQVATGASMVPGILLRESGNDYYRARLHFSTAGGMFVSVTQNGSTVGSTPPLSYTYTAGQEFWLRARITGQTVRLRAWPDGMGEPAHRWDHEVEITSVVIASGALGVTGSAFAGNTNTDPVIAFHYFEVVTPQRMTVTRSINGIVKPHDAGSDVRLTRPAIVAL